VLHLLSTAVMVRLGRVEGNLMTNVVPASRKLERRALHILMTLGGVEPERARALLEECRGSVHEALRRIRR
jgi:N-acetylmuramic acid 6-phosphate etherase